MRRDAESKLLEWKNNKSHKPLIVAGARQVGKTWLMQEFGRVHYSKTAYIKFDNNPRAAAAFAGSMSPKDLLPYLQAEAGVTITPSDTLVIFDEVQEVPRAVTALKYFSEEAPQIDVMAAGSSLGIAMHKGTSFPVGKVSFLDLYPLTFGEYLQAVGEEQLADMLMADDEQFASVRFFHEKLIGQLKQYMFVGGMPEVVARYSEDADFVKAREIQDEIIRTYRNDFSKYAPAELIPRLELVWDSIASQLSRENKKFIYTAVKPGGRGRDFELAIKWLEDCSLVYKIPKITTPREPMKSYEDFGAFKLFMSDVGLLGALSKVTARMILDGDDMFTHFKGALAEQYVCQEMIASKFPSGIGYWSSETSKNEIDFAFQSDDYGVVPVEVKSGENRKAKSLKTYIDKFEPRLAFRLSSIEAQRGEKIYDLPLYAVSRMRRYV
jgi:predicted AAA+ superfamily ATPase